MGRRQRQRRREAARRERPGWRESLFSTTGRTMLLAALLTTVSVAALVWATLPGSGDGVGDDGAATAGGGRLVDVDESLALVEAREGVLVDTRSAQSYERGHAMGAVLAPEAEVQANPDLPALTEIPDEIAMILYCT